MLIKKPDDIKGSEITDESVYAGRREFLKSTAALAGAAVAAPSILLSTDVEAAVSFRNIRKTGYKVDDRLTPWKHVTGYNNFYEFGTGKYDPARYAPQYLKTKPWTVEIAGEAEKTGVFSFEDLVKPHQLEERIYRFRCVEAWSMVIPWVGIPLASILKRFKPTSKAKFVQFTTLHDEKQMPGQKRGIIDWPYVEGLRIDEAMHPLTLMAVGVYGKEMPPQNGAPLRLVVPWKYGFKSIKSIVKISFTEKQPKTSWVQLAPHEYGFYCNVNPDVSHPRWSQRKERRIGEFKRRKTEFMNGYGEQVAKLYSGMDLRKYF